MTRCWVFVVLLALLSGCESKTDRMAQPEDPQGQYREQIEVAKRVLEQYEDWADRAEWEVLKSSDGWQVIAWRVEHPERKGAQRYVPWGYSTIEIDRRLVAVGYHRKG
jgi:hypothetical protein